MRQFDSVDELNHWLNEQGIDTGSWGQDATKSIANLWNEIEQGETEIEVENGEVRRVVQVVRVIVRRDDQILIEAGQDFEDGQRRNRHRPPSEKMKPDESYLDAAIRCLQEELGLPPESVEVLPLTHRRKEWEGASDSYPGLCTHYTFHIVEARVTGLPKGNFATDEEATGPGDPVSKHYWEWRKTG